jgi:uroporphyrinogen-III synthase
VRPLEGKRVLVTRPLGDDEELSALLRSKGAEPIAAPAIAFAMPDDPGPLEAALTALPDYTWCAFTSARGVEAFFARLAARGRQLPPRLLFAAVGPKTAAALARYGREPDIVPDAFSAGGVAAALEARLQVADRILVVRA